jgi:hypothetical protein
MEAFFDAEDAEDLCFIDFGEEVFPAAPRLCKHGNYFAPNKGRPLSAAAGKKAKQTITSQ